MAAGLSRNPVQQHNLQAKRKQIRKSKDDQQKIRDERIKARNPAKMLQQIERLKNLRTKNGLTSSDKHLLNVLECDWNRLKKLNKGHVPIIDSDERRLGHNSFELFRNSKLQRPDDPTKSVFYDAIYNPKGYAPPEIENRFIDEIEVNDEASSSSNTTDDEVRKIPMPKGIPPPLSEEEYNSDSSNSVPGDSVITSNSAQIHGTYRRITCGEVSGLLEDSEISQNSSLTTFYSRQSYNVSSACIDVKRAASSQISGQSASPNQMQSVQFPSAQDKYPLRKHEQRHESFNEEITNSEPFEASQGRAKITYEADPQLRDFRSASVKFVPSILRRKQ